VMHCGALRDGGGNRLAHVLHGTLLNGNTYILTGK
jgi:hypothetical protein